MEEVDFEKLSERAIQLSDDMLRAIGDVVIGGYSVAETLVALSKASYDYLNNISKFTGFDLQMLLNMYVKFAHTWAAASQTAHDSNGESDASDI